MSSIRNLSLLAHSAVLACARPAAAGYFFYGYWFSHGRA